MGGVDLNILWKGSSVRSTIAPTHLTFAASGRLSRISSVTDILDPAEPKLAKKKRDHTKDKGGKETAKVGEKEKHKHDQTKIPAHTHLARRPDHEQPAKFPTGLKRPDLDATVDGNKNASEAQRQLYDDIKRGNCTRCHKGGHVRRDCKDPKAKWEEKFDKEKEKY
jgi:hypothetical protein